MIFQLFNRPHQSRLTLYDIRSQASLILAQWKRSGEQGRDECVFWLPGDYSVHLLNRIKRELLDDPAVYGYHLFAGVWTSADKTYIGFVRPETLNACISLNKLRELNLWLFFGLAEANPTSWHALGGDTMVDVQFLLPANPVSVAAFPAAAP